MGRLAPLLLVVVVGSSSCSSKKLGDSGPGTAGGAIGGSGGSGSAGSGTTVGAGGSGAGGATTVGAGGSATAGSAAGANGGAGAAGTGVGAGGAAAGSGGASGGVGGGDGPLRLVIFYTRWGTSYPGWFPTGTGRTFSMSAMLQPLDAHKSDLVVISGLTNATVRAGSLSVAGSMNMRTPDEAMTTILTARAVPTAGQAQGPSLDTVVGDCGGAAGPPLRLAVGTYGYDGGPGVSFDASGAPVRGEGDPHAVAMRVLGHDVTAPSPTASIDTSYPAIGAAQMAIATEALASAKTCAVTLMWGDQVTPTWLGLTSLVHDLSRFTNSTYAGVATSSPTSNLDAGFQKLQTWYAQQFGSLLDALKAVPLGQGSMLDRSVVIWISDIGAGSDDIGYYIPVVIAGGAGGHLDRGRVLEIKPHTPPSGTFIDYQAITRTQGDLLAALASLWGIGSFGDPLITRQPLTEILLP